MSAFVFDESRWPLLVLRIPERYTHEEFVDHCNRVRAYFERKERFAMVTDARGSYHPNATQRRLMVSTIELAGTRALNCVGCAVVVNSGLLAGVLTALQWATKLPYPSVNVTSPLEAEEWCRQRLAARSAA